MSTESAGALAHSSEALYFNPLDMILLRPLQSCVSGLFCLLGQEMPQDGKWFKKTHIFWPKYDPAQAYGVSRRIFLDAWTLKPSRKKEWCHLLGSRTEIRFKDIKDFSVIDIIGVTSKILSKIPHEFTISDLKVVGTNEDPYRWRESHGLCHWSFQGLVKHCPWHDSESELCYQSYLSHFRTWLWDMSDVASWLELKQVISLTSRTWFSQSSQLRGLWSVAAWKSRDEWYL